MASTGEARAAPAMDPPAAVVDDDDDDDVDDNAGGPEPLDCGTSLAELEHAVAPPPRGQEGGSLPSGEAVRNGSSSGNGCSSPGTDAAVDSVEALRDLLAADVCKPEGAAAAACTTFESPFPRDLTPGAPRAAPRRVPLVYCDHTASQRPLRSVERYLAEVCLPLYGNTHTNTSVTGSQSTAFVAEARQLVAEAAGARTTGKAGLDVVLFAGQGATAAVELLIDCLGLAHATAGAGAAEGDGSARDRRPVAFVGPYEHHSTIVPFREAGCEVVMVPECPARRGVDVRRLERLLQQPQFGGDRLRMGVFSAASNVTGRVTDTDEISAVLHRHGALAFFDYATAASYLTIDMNPPPSERYPSASLIAKDAVFLSPHKMLGGVGSPGVLIVKKHLVSQTNPPKRSGGGTVFYVTNSHHRFLSNRVERYEGGSPNVPGIIRVGLSLLLKRKAEQMYAVARRRQIANGDSGTRLPASIEEYDYQTYRRVTRYLQHHAPNVVLLDPPAADDSRKLPIFSFLIRFGSRFLHYNYVCAILNDVFGIQSRGGCQCAGPYSQRLLGLTTTGPDGVERQNESNAAIEQALVRYKEKAELIRPGFTRISLPYKGSRSDDVDYVMKALEWTSKYGWALICQYRCNHRTGEFRHASRQGRPLGPERKWLGHFEFPLRQTALRQTASTSANEHKEYTLLLKEALESADLILKAALADQSSIAQALKMSEADTVLGTDDAQEVEKLRWYVYARECASYLAKGITDVPTDKVILGPIQPNLQSQSLDLTSDWKDGSTGDENKEVGQIDEVGRRPGVTVFMKESHRVPVKTDKKANRDETTWGLGQPVQGPVPAISPCQNAQKPALNSRSRHIKPPAKIMRLITNAVMQWDMIHSGDRLLLGLSGGKDSLTLLHCLMELQRKLPTKFDLEVCTIDPQTPSFDPSPLIPYVESLGLKYHYIRDNIVDRANTSGTGGTMVKSLCAYCARMKRGNLYACARRNNCNKLVLAQHLDDCAESFMMSVMHNGFLRTMKANYKINSGDLIVIRPMVYCRESLMTDFSKTANLPVINENCPACFEEPKERARVKKLLSREETLYPNFYDNIRRSLLPLMHEDATAILRCYTESVLAKSRKVDKRERSSEETADQKVVKRAKTIELTAANSLLNDISDDLLVSELARRKAEKFHLAGAMKRSDMTNEDTKQAVDAAEQVCSINGGCGVVPCYELME